MYNLQHAACWLHTLEYPLSAAPRQTWLAIFALTPLQSRQCHLENGLATGRGTCRGERSRMLHNPLPHTDQARLDMIPSLRLMRGSLGTANLSKRVGV